MCDPQVLLLALKLATGYLPNDQNYVQPTSSGAIQAGTSTKAEQAAEKKRREDLKLIRETADRCSKEAAMIFTLPIEPGPVGTILQDGKWVIPPPAKK